MKDRTRNTRRRPAPPESSAPGFHKLAREAKANGDEVLAGIYRAEAGNDRSNWVKVHKPSLGPYTPTNPRLCRDCGHPLQEGDWDINERCYSAAGSRERWLGLEIEGRATKSFVVQVTEIGYVDRLGLRLVMKPVNRPDLITIVDYLPIPWDGVPQKFVDAMEALDVRWWPEGKLLGNIALKDVPYAEAAGRACQITLGLRDWYGAGDERIKFGGYRVGVEKWTALEPSRAAVR